MFEGHPKGLKVLFFTEMWERFGFYTMLAVFVYYLQENFGWDEATASNVYGWFMAGVYFTPIIGGWIADNMLGYGKTIKIGAIVMFLGYGMMAIPNPGEYFLYFSLLIVCIGNGFFKANISVLVGNLYKHSDKSLKDAAYLIFYMGINVGAFYAPFAASGIKDFLISNYGFTAANAHNGAFAIASAGMLLSLLIFSVFKKHYADADFRSSKVTNTEKDLVLTKKQERDRVISLLIIFAIVVFFWMAFHQNGSALSYFARDYSHPTVGGLTYLLFDFWSLHAILFVLLGAYFFFKKETQGKSKIISAAFLFAGLAYLIYELTALADNNFIDPEKYQSFNPMFIFLISPLMIYYFAFLNKRGKEPSTPAKIGIGMFITGLAFSLLMFASFGLPAVHTLGEHTSAVTVTPFYLIGSYFIITLAELHLSPMGLSFVSKVAPPKLKGLMMGGWFGATAVGNYLSGFIGRFYQNWELWQFFLLLVVFALLGALMIRIVLKKLKIATE